MSKYILKISINF